MPFLFLFIGFAIGGTAAAVRPRETRAVLDIAQRTALDRALLAAALPALSPQFRAPLKALST